MEMIDPTEVVKVKTHGKESATDALIRQEKLKSVQVDPNFSEISVLPTMYKFYPNKIYARSLNVIEVKKLTSITPENAETIATDILSKATRGVNVNDIFLVDKFYILLYLRAITFSNPNYSVEFDCPICKHEKSRFHFSVSDLTVEYLGDDFDLNTVTKLSNGDELTFKFLNVLDQLEMNNYKVVAAKSLDVDDELLHIACSINTINGEYRPVGDRLNYMIDGSITAEDFSDITSRIHDFAIGVNPVMNAKCKECGGVSEILIPFRDAFFLPKKD